MLMTSSMKSQKTKFFYPNPSKGIVNIISDKEIKSVEVIDLSGRTIALFNSNTINISHLNDGLYLLRLRTLDAVFIEKISLTH